VRPASASISIILENLFSSSSHLDDRAIHFYGIFKFNLYRYFDSPPKSLKSPFPPHLPPTFPLAFRAARTPPPPVRGLTPETSCPTRMRSTRRGEARCGSRRLDRGPESLLIRIGGRASCLFHGGGRSLREVSGTFSSQGIMIRPSRSGFPVFSTSPRIASMGTSVRSELRSPQATMSAFSS